MVFAGGGWGGAVQTGPWYKKGQGSLAWLQDVGAGSLSLLDLGFMASGFGTHLHAHRHRNLLCRTPPPQALRSLVSECITPDVAAAGRANAAAGAAAGKAHQAAAGPLASVVAAVASSLSASYQEAWGMALPGARVRARVRVRDVLVVCCSAALAPASKRSCHAMWLRQGSRLGC